MYLDGVDDEETRSPLRTCHFLQSDTKCPLTFKILIHRQKVGYANIPREIYTQYTQMRWRTQTIQKNQNTSISQK